MGYERVEFDKIKAWLKTIKTEEAVRAEEQKFMEAHQSLSQKQQDALARIFAERVDQIDDELNGVEHWADKR